MVEQISKKQSEKPVLKDRLEILKGLSAAHVDTLDILSKQMKGKTGAELLMLQKASLAVKASMSKYVDLIDLEQQKKIQAQQSKDFSPTEKKSREAAEQNFSLQEDMQALLSKIVRAYKELGFDCEAKIAENGKINVDVKMPEQFKGQDPLKLSAADLSKAREALTQQKPGTSPEKASAHVLNDSKNQGITLG
ncbi:MAG: hypothetical protein EBS06_08640 [Proteobacteria bacterium]|nr:hypothetical protein [Pseudomonadota bacterium]